MIDLLTLFFVGLLGLALHYFVRWSRGDLACSFQDYMLKEKKYTIASLGSLFAAVAAVYAGSDAVEMSKQTIAMVFMSGYMIDNTMNKAPE